MARAELTLSGKVTGSFVDEGQANTTITNNASADTALWESGIAYNSGQQPTYISFAGDTFVDVTSGDPIQVGVFTIHNGIDYAGTTADSALFNLGIDLTSPVTDSFGLTQFTFGIDNTLNNPGNIPDDYAVAFTQPPPMVIDNTDVQFHVVYQPTDTSVPEGDTVTRGDVYVTFTPVPEPATYALWGALLLGGIVAYRRLAKLTTGFAGAA